MSPLHLPCHHSRHFIKPFTDGSGVPSKTRLWPLAAALQCCSGRGSSHLQKGFPAQLLLRWVEPKGMGVLWGQTEPELLFAHPSWGKGKQKTGFLQKRLIPWALPILRECSDVCAPEQDLISSWKKASKSDHVDKRGNFSWIYSTWLKLQLPMV